MTFLPGDAVANSRDLGRLSWMVPILYLVLILLSLPAAASTKVALVIGNGAYRNVAALPNPPSDAEKIGNALERLGFAVTRLQDGTYNDMRSALLAFGRTARGAEMAAVFYAGHGIEAGGENWLIPVEAELKSDIDFDHEALSLRGVMATVESASKLGLVILDACRNNPFAAKMNAGVRTRSVSRGLAQVEPRGNVLVAYAAKDGTVAADGEGGNSPFTAAILQHIETPGLEINFLFRNVRDDVVRATKREQQPFVYGSLSREAIFLKEGLLPVLAMSPPTAAPTLSGEEIAWTILKNSTDPAALKRFIEQFPQGLYRLQAQAQLDAISSTPPSQPERTSAAPSSERKPARPGCFNFQGRRFCE